MVSLVAEFPNDNPALHGGVSWVCLDVTGAPVPVTEVLAPALAAAAEPGVQDVVDATTSAVPEARVDATTSAVPEALVDATASAAVPEARISGVVGLGTTPREDSALDLAAAYADAVEADDDADDALILVEELPPLDEAAVVEESAASASAPPAATVAPAFATVAPVAATAAPAATVTIPPPPGDDPFTILVSTLADVAIGAGSPHVASMLPGLLLEGTLDAALPEDAALALADANVVRAAVVTAAFVAQTRAWQAILRGTSDDFGACGGAMLDEWAADVLARLLGSPLRATALRRELRARGVAAFGLVEAA